MGLALARARLRPGGGGVGGQTLMQGVRIEAARVPLHQPVQRSRCMGPGHRHEDGGAIETRVRPHQERQTRRRAGTRQQSFEEIRGFAGRVLGARTQFKTQAVAFLRQVAGDRCVAVEAHVGAAHAFLGGAAGKFAHNPRWRWGGAETVTDSGIHHTHKIAYARARADLLNLAALEAC